MAFAVFSWLTELVCCQEVLSLIPEATKLFPGSPRVYNVRYLRTQNSKRGFKKLPCNAA